MRAGDLDKSIALQSATAVQDAAGQPIESWATFATVAAKVTPAKGGESLIGQQVIGTAVTTFKIRYRSDVSVLTRVVYNARNWDVRAVREIGRREALEIDATARSETGTP